MKLMLHCELIGDKSVKFRIIYMSRDVKNLDYDIDGKVFKDGGITIWNFSNFFFNENQIRLPDTKSKIHEYTHKFKSERERYKLLKKYFKALNKWSLSDEMFPNNYIIFKNRISFNKTLWEIK